MRTQMYINGEWTDGVGSSTFTTIDPSNGQVIAELTEASPEDVDAAVIAAQEAFVSPEWSGLTPAARARLLWRIADAVEERLEDLAQLETLDQGQPLWLSRIIAGNVAEHFRYYAGWVTKITGMTASLSVADADMRTVREPLGVCGLIVPWNFPMGIAAWKVAPALAAGNTVILKAAEQTPLTSLLLAEIFADAGLPRGVVNVVTGGPEVGKAIVRHPDIVKISFTGSSAVGRWIGGEAGSRLKRVSLELGGKTPSILTPGTDIDAVLTTNLISGIMNSGQVCGAFARYYVHSSQVDEFVEKLAAAAAQFTVGPGAQDGVFLGPLVSEEHLRNVEGYVATAVNEGARIVTGGSRVEGDLIDGFFFPPTVLADVEQSSTVAQEEIFGPVLSVISYDNVDDLVTLANDSPYGLGAAVWSDDLRQANRLARDIRSGTVFVNMGALVDPAAPWGGIKGSGIGREMGYENIEAFTEVKTIWTARS